MDLEEYSKETSHDAQFVWNAETSLRRIFVERNSWLVVWEAICAVVWMQCSRRDPPLRQTLLLNDVVLLSRSHRRLLLLGSHNTIVKYEGVHGPRHERRLAISSAARRSSLEDDGSLDDNGSFSASFSTTSTRERLLVATGNFVTT